MFEHLNVTPEFVLNCLKFLLDFYKVAGDRFKDKKTPDRVGEIVIQAEKSPKPDTQQIEQSIAQDLDPADAAIVEEDLKLLTFVMIPRPPLDAFDYWGKFVQLVNGLQAFAARNHLFELRGMNDQRFGESLPLIRTSKVLMYKEFADSLSIHTEHLQKTECKVRLLKAHEEFPIRVWLQATLDRTTRLGGKFSEVCSDAFKVEPGQQKHWLRFRRLSEGLVHFREREYRLDAEDLISIVNAMRDDINELAKEVQADANKIGPLFKQIDEFTRGLPNKDGGIESGK